MEEDRNDDLTHAEETSPAPRRRQGAKAQGSEPTRQGDLSEQAAEAAYWRAKYQEERERLAKLWVSYKDVEAQMGLRRAAEGARIERKVKARLGELALQERGPIEAPEDIDAEADQPPS